MAAPAEKPKAEKQMNLRVQPQVRDLIDRAAALEGKSRSEFMIEIAHERAIDVLLDQRLFLLDDEQAEAVAAALANPPKPNAALKKLMRTKVPWGVSR